MNTEDTNRKRLLALTLIVGSTILLSGLLTTHLYSYYTSVLNERIGVSLYFIPTLLIGHIILYALLRKNKIFVVSFALTTLYAIGTIYGAYTWGVSMPTTLLLFSLVIGIVGMLFSSRKAFIATIIAFILIFILGIREIHNPQITSWKEYEVEIIDIISYIVIIGISSGLTLLSNKEVEKSLKRALESEKDLEIKVEKRTQELKQSQLETLSAMSRTYELGKIAQGLFHDLITPLNSAVLYVSEYDRTQSKQYIEKQ
jgi:glucan phosphoethanolaminetransferase (alkaline phosphatase superfamily)